MSAIFSFFMCNLMLFSLDFIWISIVGKEIYEKYLGPFMRQNEHMEWSHCGFVAVIYILLTLGLCLFVIFPAQRQKSSNRHVFLHGAFFGLIVYGVYEATNYVIINGWPSEIIWIDMAWGTFVCAAAALLTTILSNRLFGLKSAA